MIKNTYLYIQKMGDKQHFFHTINFFRDTQVKNLLNRWANWRKKISEQTCTVVDRKKTSRKDKQTFEKIITGRLRLIVSSFLNPLCSWERERDGSSSVVSSLEALKTRTQLPRRHTTKVIIFRRRGDKWIRISPSLKIVYCAFFVL